MADVFISYKSERRPAARHLAKILAAYGYDVWFDYGLIPGDDFEPRLMAEIAASKVVVVLWCTLAVRSRWVRKEAHQARRQDKYLPCWIENAELPQEFAGADTINLTEWDGAPRSHLLDRLFGELVRRLGRDPTATFSQLRDIDEDWRGYGAPSLAQFALGKVLGPDSEEKITRLQLSQSLLGVPPIGLKRNLLQHWENARDGDGNALLNIAFSFANGEGGLRQDHTEAARLYKLAAERGIAGAQLNLGIMHLYGDGGVSKNEAEAVRLFRLAAEQGDAKAQFALARSYANGEGGLRQDYVEAARLYGLAAEQGNASAQLNLGVLHMTGKGGLPKNEVEGARLYRLAAEQGNAIAQCNLAQMHQSGVGAAQDDTEAARLFTLAAEQGDNIAQFALASMYALGRGVPQNYTEAVRLYSLAAKQGNARAQFSLALMYSRGLGGLPKNDTEAVRLLKLAAEQGYAKAQEHLSRRGVG